MIENSAMDQNALILNNFIRFVLKAAKNSGSQLIYNHLTRCIYVENLLKKMIKIADNQEKVLLFV
jgi:hypothetical protein